MRRSIIEILRNRIDVCPDKTFASDDNRVISYREFDMESQKVGTALFRMGIVNKKTCIFIDKSVNTLIAMFGSLYSNSFYCVMDVRSPENRIETILQTFQPDIIITDSSYNEKILEISKQSVPVVLIEELLKENIDFNALDKIIEKCIDTDPAYVLFTSGSTGIPKGTIVTHRAIISYVESVISVFDLNSDMILGNQTPFYFSMSILDIFVTVYTGGTLIIIPRKLFSFPIKVIEYLNENRINTIYWVPTALSIIANRDTFSALKPSCLSKVLFAGEVMPVKQLNYWMKSLPDVLFANLYGPTEITDTGTYYIVDREFLENERLPIGKAFPNCDVLLIKDNDEKATGEEPGEICFRGSFLGEGYYNDPVKTAEVFSQNPLNHSYPEKIYRTGDLGKYNSNGELLFLSRKDFQIKRNGYRIELGEIEANISAIQGINNCVTVFDQQKEKIVLFYSGSMETSELWGMINDNLVKYMRPDSIVKLKGIPINANGKYDRQGLLDKLKKGVYSDGRSDS